MSNNSAEIAKTIQMLFEPGGEGFAALTSALERACIGVEGSAKRKAPVGVSSNLRNSITHAVNVGEPLLGHVFTSVPYAPYVEIGTGIYSSRGDGRKEVPWHYMDEQGKWHTTSGSHPHPYLKPAMDENLSAIEKCFEGIL